MVVALSDAGNLDPERPVIDVLRPRVADINQKRHPSPPQHADRDRHAVADHDGDRRVIAEKVHMQSSTPPLCPY